MDPSAFIFVGLAVAWAAYLIPKALEHHDAGARSRSVEKFSDTMRVLARREAVDRRKTQLVTNRKPSAAEPAASAPVAEPEAAPVAAPVAESVQELDAEHTGFFAAQTFVRRSAGSRAARRRRRVLGGLLVLLAMVAAAAAGRVIGWWWVAAPVVLLVAWLVACRKMVTAERAVRRPVVQRVTDPVEPETPGVEDAVRLDDTAAVPAVRAQVAAPIASGDGWELVPVTLPTYVSKPPARRPVSTIDLDSTGVWTSGHTAADSALVQQAEAARVAGAEAASAAAASARRVSGA
ncbi:hypothetical protein GCM10009798_16870 [Nocardioides panacihumi]|uniref:DUF3040 domain-containing protein n=1 Tax=Nocardioides panacihumi TaxID=400774 RepID=A0ABP5C5D3_9ACTN